MDSSDEFAVDNEDIFQKIDSLAGKMDSGAASFTGDEGGGDGDLPSARTLRGGRGVVARGRHAGASPSRSSAASWSSSLAGGGGGHEGGGRGSASPSMLSTRSSGSSSNSFGGSGR